ATDLPERLEADKAVIAGGRLRDLLSRDDGEATWAEDDERPDLGGRGVSNSSWGSNLNLLVGLLARHWNFADQTCQIRDRLARMEIRVREPRKSLRRAKQLSPAQVDDLVDTYLSGVPGAV